MEKEQQLSGKLTKADLKKCGIGTENACFAITMGPNGMECSGVGAQQGDETKAAIFNRAGIQLGWRVNVDQTDKKAWCPKGVLNNSKQSRVKNCAQKIAEARRQPRRSVANPPSGG